MSPKIVHFAQRPSPEEQARCWIARIDAAPLTTSEREQLRAWLDEDRRHAQLLDTHALLWDAAARATFAQTLAPANDRARQNAGSRRWLAPALTACACVLVAVGLWHGAWDAPPQEAPPAATISTEVGEHRPVALTDGSQMHLNTGSKARVVFSKERRRIQLEAGEGYFDVAKDAKRPFEVAVGSTLVRAVGTRFLVRRQANGQAEVTVFEGAVELIKAPAAEGPAPGARRAQPSQPPVRLVVGQSATEQEHVVVLRSLPERALAQKLAWQQDRIVFDNTPLAAAVEQVNRYGTVPLVLGDDMPRDMRVSGAFSTRDIPIFLRSLEQGFGLQIEQRPEGYLISRSGSR
jgi:transmembrane sensor